MSASEQYSFPPVIIYTGRRAVARGRGAAAALLALGHRQGRTLARAAARRGDAVPAPGRVAPAARRRSGCCEAARERDEFFEGKTHPAGRRRRPQRLRAHRRARAARRDDGRSPATAAKAVEQARREPAGSRADGHHDAGDGRPDRDARAASATRRCATCRSSRSPPRPCRDDHEQCLAAGANDYMAKPIDVDKLVSLCRVWMSR